MSSVDPTNPNATPATSSSTSDAQPPAPFFPPNAPRLPPSDPWYKMMQKLFPSTPPDQLGVYAAQFEKNVLNSINTTIGKIQQKQHDNAQLVKQILEGDD